MKKKKKKEAHPESTDVYCGASYLSLNALTQLQLLMGIEDPKTVEWDTQNFQYPLLYLQLSWECIPDLQILQIHWASLEPSLSN